MDLLRQFQSFFKKEDLLSEENRFLVAVSGGIDSMVLAHLCRASGLLFAMAHVNFGLRGEASDADEAFVFQTGKAWGIKVFTHKVQTEKEAVEHHESVQMAARRLRYAWFEHLCEHLGYACTATGHNLNDQVETLFINLKRGTGINGLCGIPVRQGRVVRPLAFATRAEIELYARENGIPWREDSSNALTEYTRNRIRHTVLPVFEALNPGFLHTAERTMKRIEEDRKNLDAFIHQVFPAFQTTVLPSAIALDTLKSMPSPTAILRRLLNSLPFSDDQLEQLGRKLNERGFEITSNDGHYRLSVEQHHIRLDQPAADASPVEPVLVSEDDVMVRLPNGKTLVVTPASTAPPFPDGKEAVAVDASRLVWPLVLRPWAPGDSFQPFGMQGRSQKIQDFLVNQKASKRDKEQLLLLVNGDGTVLWLPGFRPDERFKIGPETRHAVKFALV